jgi:3-hydroxyacyl-CoA dehydrogenase
MGAGIAINFLESKIPVIILDSKPEFVEAGLARIQRHFHENVKKGRLTKEQAQAVLNQVEATTDFNRLANVDIVIEAVFENLEIKKQVFGQLDRICKKDALLCSNTSGLDIDQIAASTSRAEFVAGTHFFSPANIMKLLEVVRGKQSSPATLGKLMLTLSKQLNKVPVLVGNCEGFVGNRMIAAYSAQAVFLLEEGLTPDKVDSVICEFGFPMGPFQMGDLSGLDIGVSISKERLKRNPAIRNSQRWSDLPEVLVNSGRLGQKTKKGWYNYEPRPGAPGAGQPVASPEVAELIAQHRQKLNLTRTSPVSAQEILERLLFPLINTGFHLLEEGIALRSSDIDIVYIYGYGWPRWRGGPMWYAENEVSLKVLLERLQHYSKQHPTVPQLAPAPLLVRLVQQGMSLKQFDRSRLAASLSSSPKL